jgi:hypothetical protein
MKLHHKFRFTYSYLFRFAHQEGESEENSSAEQESISSPGGLERVKSIIQQENKL